VYLHNALILGSVVSLSNMVESKLERIDRMIRVSFFFFFFFLFFYMACFVVVWCVKMCLMMRGGE
jgi:hypothetical protein